MQEGLFRKYGVLDFAGGTVVHLSSGVAALGVCFALGPRSQTEQDEKAPRPNVPFVLIGTALLWVREYVCFDALVWWCGVLGSLARIAKDAPLVIPIHRD